MISGCNGTEHEKLHITILNSTPQKLTEAQVRFGKNIARAGVLIPSSHKTHMFFESPVTSPAVLTWQDSSGIQHEEKLVLDKIYDPKKPGELLFTIEPTTVKVEFRPE